MTTTTLHVDTDTGEVTAEDGTAIGNTHDELFDTKPYTIPVPTLDGHRADTLKLAFAGNVEIDAMLDENLEHFKNLRFGKEVELRITATVAKTGWAIKTNSETGEEKVTHTVGLNVHSYETR